METTGATLQLSDVNKYILPNCLKKVKKDIQLKKRELDDLREDRIEAIRGRSTQDNMNDLNAQIDALDKKISELIELSRRLVYTPTTQKELVSLGNMVLLELDGVPKFFFLDNIDSPPQNGVRSLSPESPLFRELWGKKKGDVFQYKTRNKGKHIVVEKTTTCYVSEVFSYYQAKIHLKETRVNQAVEA